jgi:hypothetical protein
LNDKYKTNSEELLKTQKELYLFNIRNASNPDGNMSKEDYLKREFSAYQISLEEFSAYLTGLYAQLYTYFNSPEFLTDLQDNGTQMMKIDDFRKLNIYNRVFKMDLFEISSLFEQHYYRKFDLNENNIDPLDKGSIKNLFKSNRNIGNEIKTLLRTNTNVLNSNRMEEIFFENLIRPIFKKYSNAAMVTIPSSFKILFLVLKIFSILDEIFLSLLNKFLITALSNTSILFSFKSNFLR